MTPKELQNLTILHTQMEVGTISEIEVSALLMILRAHVVSVAALEKLIDKIIPYAMTNTSIIQSSPVVSRLPPIVSEDGKIVGAH